MKKMPTANPSFARSDLIKGFIQAGFIIDESPVHVFIESERDKIRKKELEHFLRALDSAHKKTANSSLKFDSLIV